MSEPKVRLLKLLVQPTYVLDDGEHLRELPVQPIQVDPEGWNDFVDKGLDEVRLEVLKRATEA